MDPVASLLLDEAAPLGRRVVVVDDADGIVTTAARAAGAEVVTYCDDIRARGAAGTASVPELTAGVLAAADQVLVRLPRAVDALAQLAELIALHANDSVRIVGSGRVKHMTRGMNAALARRFTTVTASLGRAKCRALHAAGPRPGPLTWPRTGYISELDLHVVAHGGVFAGRRLDAGTRLLLSHLPAGPRGVAVDVGSGSGLISAWLARQGSAVTATETSAAAVRSTAATAAANGVQVTALHSPALTGVPQGSVDLVVSNPPFHLGGAKQTEPTAHIIRDAARALRPGGELWLVFNSHLPYLTWLRRDIGPTRVMAQDRSYLVTRTTAR